MTHEKPISFTAAQLEDYLDGPLAPALSSRRTATGVAHMLAACPRSQQDFVLHWVRVIAHNNAELAYQFANNAAQAFTWMEVSSLETWIIQAMDIYDKQGLYAAAAVFNDIESFVQAQKSKGLALDAVQAVLALFVAGLSGRSLKLQSDAMVYTDTETLFLPPFINYFTEREDNFRVYKVMAVHLWAQTRFGTWRLKLSETLQSFPDPDRACQCFHTLERLRLDACIARELPGIYRDMQMLLRRLGEAHIPPGWSDIAVQLAQVTATAQDSYDLLSQVYDKPLPSRLCYQGILKPACVEAVMAARILKEKAAFRVALVQIAQENSKLLPVIEMPTFSVTTIPDVSQPSGFQFTLNLSGQPIVPPDKVKSLMDSIIQDIGLIPPDYLVAAGDGGYQLSKTSTKTCDPNAVWKGVYHEEGAFLYNEWDYERQHYRKNWCVLREIDVFPQSEHFVTQTLARHSGLVKQLRRTFEALRGEDKLLKGQPDGDDIDLDALIRAYTEMQQGLEMTDRLFTQFQKHERNIAVLFMIDMSGSTKGWINEAEKESLVLLCEALETLGDRYAIYGFSGMTRKRCEVYRVKRFDEPYTNLVQQRISGIKPQDYTRMGVAIRHLTHLLSTLEARIKLLVTLSDGRPDDYGDNYRGQYGIEDTRQALIEAKREGIHPFCITLDTEAKAYLAHMYGAVNYIVIDEVRQLPLKVSDIYRKLTS